MNKLRYRVIFNKTRGLLMAVSELGRSHGAGVLDGGQAGPSGMAVARLRPSVFAALVLAGAQLQVLPMARAQIVADPSAPRAQQPVVLNTASGVPQVNITTPSAAGVSRNTYSQFDVNKPGAILNNARNDVQTQTGSWVQRNPNLATGTARVILNEVNSSHPSFLRGYVEVAGDRAQVVIANPSGITCDGCGFINASRTTLTTGTAVMNNGSLDGFVVRRGTVTVQGDGMDASQSDYANIIARAVRVNAGIWSRELRVTRWSNIPSRYVICCKNSDRDSSLCWRARCARWVLCRRYTANCCGKAMGNSWCYGNKIESIEMIKNKDIHAVLLRMVDLLNVGGAAGWAAALDKVVSKISINPSAASSKILSMYGGMGSLNDVILYKDGQPLALENTELNELREKLYQLCRE